MAARKLGRDHYGTWDRDENNLACYRLDPLTIPAWAPAMPHVVSTGRLAALADRFGAIRMFAGPADRRICLQIPGPAAFSALHVRLDLGESHGPRLLYGNAFDAESDPSVECGIGYIRYRSRLAPGPGTSIETVMTLSAPPDQAFFVADIELTFTGDAEMPGEIDIGLDVAPPCDGHPFQGHPFLKEGIAMFADVDATCGDVFIAGPDTWDARAGDTSLHLLRGIRLQAGEPWSEHALIGCRHDTTVAWARDARNDWHGARARRAWTDRIDDRRIRAPELWMREELQWTRGRLLALTAPRHVNGPRILQPGGAASFRMDGPCVREPGASVRDLCWLAIAAADIDPELALNTLTAVSECQGSGGRLPETLGGDAGENHPNSRAARSDLEISFALAWCELATRRRDQDVMGQMVRGTDGVERTAWDCVRRALDWVRNELGEGAHGLVRILAGDRSSFLNRVGISGRGESTVNTAVLAVVLGQVIQIARLRGETSVADRSDVWRRHLMGALADTYDRGRFRRAYTDEGQPVGGTEEGRLFLEAQTWCLLARAGTSEQRQTAVDTVLAACGDHTPALLLPPYAIPAPADISHDALPPGEGGNGGCDMMAVAWWTVALAGEGRAEEALACWTRLSCRRRAGAGTTPALLVSAVGLPCSFWAGHREGSPGQAPAACSRSLPDAHAVAWQEFALRAVVR